MTHYKNYKNDVVVREYVLLYNVVTEQPDDQRPFKDDRSR